MFISLSKRKLASLWGSFGLAFAIKKRVARFCQDLDRYQNCSFRHSFWAPFTHKTGYPQTKDTAKTAFPHPPRPGRGSKPNSIFLVFPIKGNMGYPNLPPSLNSMFGRDASPFNPHGVCQNRNGPPYLVVFPLVSLKTAILKKHTPRSARFICSWSGNQVYTPPETGC